MVVSQKTKYFVICAFIVLATMAAFYWRTTWYLMPGQSFKGVLPPLTADQVVIRNRLSEHVDVLAKQCGERNSRKLEALYKAADYIATQFTEYGYAPKFQEYEVDGKKYKNIEVELIGSNPQLAKIIVGAHYDSAIDSPGGNDNASGVACLLEMARAMHGKQSARTIRFVALVNGEPPFQMTENSGSSKYAQRSKELGEKIKGMISLDEIGYFSDLSSSEKLPPNIFSFYPAEGNFIMFLANGLSANVCRSVVGGFRSNAKFPSEGLISKESTNPAGMDGSDHYAFWKVGYPAVMVTDTFSDRYPYVHNQLDTASQVDVDKVSRLVGGFKGVVEELANN